MQAIRNFLKRIFPPTIRMFNQDITRIFDYFEDDKKKWKEYRDWIECQNSMINEKITALQENVIILSENLKVGELQVNKKIENLESIIPNKPVLWSNSFEKDVIASNWGDVTERSDFSEKFLKLIKGMDAKSVEIIIRILMRQKEILSSDQASIDFYTRKEQEEIRLLNENFSSSIFEISKDLFAYKNYLLPINHFECSVFYFRHGLNQLETLSRVMGKAILDVGGYVGDSILILSELSPGTIYTFEAVPANFALLKKTVELNRIPNVVAENVALGAGAGICKMHVGGSSSSTIERPGLNYTDVIEVPMIKLDDYVEEHNIEVGLIKVDIEGGEPLFLEGAKRTICEQKPILLLSIYHNAHDFFELKPLLEDWNLGYQFSIHKPTYGNATSETLLLAEVL